MPVPICDAIAIHLFPQGGSQINACISACALRKNSNVAIVGCPVMLI
ncbi:MAG: hypothetical protein ACHBN1_04160 [Heteroscytonema crispum UTEX LB 1556]